MALNQLELDLIYRIKDIDSSFCHVLRNEFVSEKKFINVYSEYHDLAIKVNQFLDERNNPFYNLCFTDKDTMLNDGSSIISFHSLFRSWIGKLFFEEVIKIKDGQLFFIKNSYVLESSDWIPEKVIMSNQNLIIFDLNQFEFLTNNPESVIDTLNDTKETSSVKYHDFVLTQEFETNLKEELAASTLDEEYADRIMYAFCNTSYDMDTSTMAKIILELKSFSDSCLM